MQITIGSGRPSGPHLSMSGGSTAVTRVISKVQAGEGRWRMLTLCTGIADGIYLLLPVHVKVFALSTLLYLIVIGVGKLSYRHGLVPIRTWLHAAWANVIRQAERSVPDDVDISKPSVKRYTAIARGTSIMLRPSTLDIPRSNARLAKLDADDGDGTLVLPRTSTLVKHAKTAVKVPVIATTRIVTGKTVDPRYHHESTFHVRSKDFAMYRDFREWWGRQAHRTRLLMHALLAGLLSLAMTYATEDPTGYLHVVTLVLLCMTGSLVGGACVVVGWRLHPWKTHRRTVVQPLGDVLTDVISVVKLPRVPRKFGVDGAGPVIVYLPINDKLQGKTKSEIQACVSMKTGLGDLIATWHTLGAEPYVTFMPLPQPPKFVGWSEVKELALRQLDNAKETRILIGLGRGKEAIYLDNVGEDPHVAVGGMTGCGKSEAMKMMMAQYAYRGDRVIIIDVKRISHLWAKGLTSIEYFKDIEEISQLLRDIADNELAERTRLVDSGSWDSKINPGRRIYIFIDELSSTISMLSEHWREDGNRGPAPSVVAFRKILKLGRAVKIFLEPADQSWDCNGVGGPQARENFGPRLLARYTSQMWGKLCREVKPMPRKSSVRGRWQLVMSGEATEVQLAFMTDTEARELVLAGSNVVHADAERLDRDKTWNNNGVNGDGNDGSVPAVPAVPANTLQASDQAIQLVPGTAGTGNGPPGAGLITLRAYCEGLTGLAVPELNTFRKRVKTDQKAPAPTVASTNGDRYQIVELHAWHRAWEVEHGKPVSTLSRYDDA